MGREQHGGSECGYFPGGVMAFRGRYFLGDRLPLSLLCVNGSGVPSVPDRSPYVLLFSGSSLIVSYRIPVHDKQGQTGLFQFVQQLDSRFAVGRLRAVFQYKISGTNYGSTDTAEIVAGGDANGAGVGLYYFRAPQADHALVQVDSGRILRRRNPRLP